MNCLGEYGIILKLMLIGFTQHELKATLGPLVLRGLSPPQAVTGGVLPHVKFDEVLIGMYDVPRTPPCPALRSDIPPQNEGGEWCGADLSR